MIDVDQLYAACLVSWTRQNDKGVFKGPAYLLAKNVSAACSLPYVEQHFNEAEVILQNMEILKTYSHEGMMRFYRLDSADFDVKLSSSIAGMIRNYQIGSLDSNTYEVLHSYADLGEDWLLEALETFREEIWSSVEADANVIPASDRVVSRDDNLEVRSEIGRTLDAMEGELSGSNEVGAALGDLRTLAADEISLLRSLLNAQRIRAASLLNQSKQTLGWIAKKAGETTVGELAKHALRLFLSWLS